MNGSLLGIMEFDSDTSDSDSSVSLSDNSQQETNKDGVIQRKAIPRKEEKAGPFFVDDRWYFNRIAVLILSGVVVFVTLYFNSNRTSFVYSSKQSHKLTTIYFLF